MLYRRLLLKGTREHLLRVFLLTSLRHLVGVGLSFNELAVDLRLRPDLLLLDELRLALRTPVALVRFKVVLFVNELCLEEVLSCFRRLVRGNGSQVRLLGRVGPIAKAELL